MLFEFRKASNKSLAMIFSEQQCTSHFYPSLHTVLAGELFLSEEIRYYRGQHKVKVVTQSEGYWTIEALEDFEDTVDKQKTTVKTGEQRIVPPNLLFKQRTLPPTVKEHEYELEMEKKLKRMVAKEDKKQIQ
jgi:hypothetical protein